MARLTRIAARIAAAFFALMFIVNVVSAVGAVFAKARLRSHGESASDRIDLATIFDAAEFAGEAAAFQGGRVITWYGSTVLDLRRATIDSAGAHLSISTLFGSTAVLVPPGWSVAVSGVPIMGAINDEALNSLDVPAGAPQLDIQAFVLFGALEIDVVAPATAIDVDPGLVPTPA